MNLSILSPEEIIQYIERGVITEAVPADQVLKIVDLLVSENKRLEALATEAENDYYKGYGKGYQAAVDEMLCKLNNM